MTDTVHDRDLISVILKKGEGRTIKSGGLWVYENEIDRIIGTDGTAVHGADGYATGEIVKVPGLMLNTISLPHWSMALRKSQISPSW